ncbi:T9SS type A sorting domain-containing protein [Kordia algicida OT-1]|uniref:T9SS type A sorting domain-containing protein n=1 Tax=Kordia algicida TaxID=221066 RepID=UPI003D9AF96B
METIADLSPIENLTNLEELVIRDVTDTSVDLSALVNLTYVSIADASLETIDLSNSSNLESLNIENMTLSSLVLNNNPLLEDIYINNVNVPNLDFSSCTALRYLLANDNTALFNLDVTQNVLLETIEFDNNALLRYVDLSNNPALTSVRAEDNAQLETIFIKNGNNTNIGQTFRVKDNPSLTCVEVDDVAWSNTFWGFPTNYFPGFSLNCAPSNDDCAQAVSITLAQPASGNTFNATNSTNTPSCQETGITILDVWYEFQAPASGSVTMTINAPPLVGKIAFYESCSDAQPLFCQEGELSVDNLTPNATYYLQVWLEADAMNRTGNPENTNGGFILNIQDSTTLSVNDIATTENQIRVYPNPAKEHVNISAPTNLEQVAIYDMSGKLILKNENYRSNQETLDLKNLSGGMYMVQIKTEKTTTLKKLIIN